MKFDSVLAVCLLLLWSLKDVKAGGGISVSTIVGGIRLSCEGEGENFTVGTYRLKKQDLPYADSSSGGYHCTATDKPGSSIFVKFRTCDNCVEVSTTSIIGLVVGELVALAALGIAVYLVASHSGPVAPQKKNPTGSDRQPIVQNAARSREANDPYQRLRFHGQRDEYDVINQRR